MKPIKKILAVVLASAMVFSLAACTNNSGASNASDSEGNDSASETSDETDSSDDVVTITFYYSKSEIVGIIEEAAARYSETHNVNLEVSFPSNSTLPYLETRYTLGDPYTIVMVDPAVFYELAPEHALDLSDQDWVDETEYAGYIDDKVYGFPLCIEARGIIYNADAIEETTGEKFDPDSITYLSDFTALLTKLGVNGMEYPVAIQKADWSLGFHFLQQVYEERPDTDAFIAQLYAGEADIERDEKFNALFDTFDVLKEYNYFWESPTKATDDQVYSAIVDGDVAFKFGGCWEWSDYITHENYTENMGIMPVPQDIDDQYTGRLVGGVTKYIFIDNSEYTTDEQREAALDFLNWMVYDEEGQSFVTNDLDLVSPFRNNQIVGTNPLANSVKKYSDAGKLIPTYDFAPSDHQTILGARMQDYLVDKISRDELAMDIEEYWISATPTVSIEK